MRKAAVLTVLLAAWLASSSNASIQQPKIFGFMDDGPVMSLAAQAGATIEKRTVWISPTNNSWAGSARGFVPVPPEYRQTIDADMAEAGSAGIKVILELYPVVKYGPPRTPSQMRGTCDVAKDLTQTYGDVLYGIEVGVEPNNYTFNHHQFNPDGTQASAVGYEQWLSICYDKIKAVNPNLEVIGGSLASNGEDDPHKPTSSTSPVLFIRKFCDALAASGRTKPTMDVLDMHNYPDPGNQSPDVQHPYPSTTITIADSAKLDGLLDCFTRSGLPKPHYIWGEGGYNTLIPDSQKKNYSGRKPASVKLVDEATEGRYIAQEIRMAYCQPHSLGYINFHMVDDADLRRNWQSGLVYAPHRQRRGTSGARTAYVRKRSWQPVSDALVAARDGTITCG